MFHKVKDVFALPNMKLTIIFTEGITKTYDLSPLLNSFPNFNDLKDSQLFSKVHVGDGGYGVVWNDSLDLSCNELWEHGTIVETPFDNLMSFGEATDLWGLNESTLRKAISYGKLVSGVDARKYGKQWIVTKEAMYREYGEPTA